MSVTSNQGMPHPYFQFGMRQPAAQLRVSFVVPPAFSISSLDRWIYDALEFETSHYRPKFIDQRPKDTEATDFLTRVLLVTSILLQDIRVPVFEAPVIGAVVPQNDQGNGYLAEIWFPVVSGFPVQVFKNWLGISSDLMTQVLAHIDDRVALERIYQAFQSSQVEPWSKKMAKGRSTIPMLQAAHELGIPFAHCGAGRYVLGWGENSRVFQRSSNSLDSAIGAQTTQNKPVALEMMRFAGIPVPKGMVLPTKSEITLEKIATLGLPVVVKPTDKDRGLGVTLGISNQVRLQQAVDHAAQYGNKILVEEQVPGTCHRILVVDDKVLFVIKRNPRSITGDGQQTIEALIKQLNASLMLKVPQKRLPGLALDALALECLAAAGLNPSSIPAAGVKVMLRPAQSSQWGGDPEVITNLLHPANAEIARRAARLFGLQCVGIDFISTDIRTPWYENGAVINEVNYAPVIGRTHEYQRIAGKAYLNLLFQNQGKIPIYLFLGAGLREASLNLWQQQVASGTQAFLFMDQDVLRPDGQRLHFSHTQTPLDKIAMLRSHGQMAAMVVHLDNALPIVKQGAPFEYATSITVSPEIKADAMQRQALEFLGPLQVSD